MRHAAAMHTGQRRASCGRGEGERGEQGRWAGCIVLFIRGAEWLFVC